MPSPRANNGSAFGGLSANTTFFNTALGFAMLFGRFASIVLVLGWPGRWPGRSMSWSAGTFPTTSPLFVGLLTGVIIIVTALTYFPALSLGPIVEGLS
jgi:K+-transporting ATPase ATPase A chain